MHAPVSGWSCDFGGRFGGRPRVGQGVHGLRLSGPSGTPPHVRVSLVPTTACLLPRGETGAPVAFTFDSEPVRLHAEPTDGGARLFDLDAGVVFDIRPMRAR